MGERTNTIKETAKSQLKTHQILSPSNTLSLSLSPSPSLHIYKYIYIFSYITLFNFNLFFCFTLFFLNPIPNQHYKLKFGILNNSPKKHYYNLIN